MKILQLTIELKSDMCCGTGTGDGVQFDTVSAYNDYGLPYIPAKRLKGLLREQAEFLIACNPENKNFVEILFGKGEQAGALIVNNAEIKNVRNLKEDLDKLFKSQPSLYNPSAVAEYYTVARHATQMKNGVAKPKSLRTIGAVPSGTIFEATLYLDDSSSSEKVEFLRNCAKLLRHIGLNRTRGYGEAVCTLEEQENGLKEYTNDSHGGRQTSTIFHYNISLETDLVSEKDYITGTALQGWFAGRIEQKNIQELLTKVKFSNAYPCIDDKFFSPMPLSYINVKNEEEIYSQADGFKRCEGKQYVKRTGYAYFDYTECSYDPYDVQKSISYHVTTKGENDLFTLPLLKAGQSFAGFIEGDPSILNKLKGILAKYNGKIRLGGSANIQFGKCVLTLVPNRNVEGDLSSNTSKDASPSGEETHVYIVNLLSDTILCDEYGLNSVSLDVLKRSVEKLFNIDEKPIIGDIYTGTITTGGYNGKWKMPRRRFSAFSMGTQICVESKIEPKRSEGFMGLLQAEGYGQYCIQKVNPELSNTGFKKSENQEKNVESEVGFELTSAGKDLKEQIDFNHLLKELEKSAYEIIETQSSLLKKTSSSSLMRLNAVYQNLNREGGEATLEVLGSVFKNSNDKNNNEQKICEAILKRFKEFKIDDIVDTDKKVRASLHYLQYILTAIKFWYKNNKGREN
ncbi:RAMP superfamily CRISPR-associated protein [Streptococcus sinensis]|uniref:RAMP superfamily CRISPR-associated protein n=1 Tax=Streptococcus sinensis TaxID=176090 RepID=UPI00272CEDA4|nr:RAMP superfamily CRISPR-associated protein [Streptococcus sinensis]